MRCFAIKIAVVAIALSPISLVRGTEFKVLPGGAIIAVQIDSPVPGAVLSASAPVSVMGRAQLAAAGDSIKDTTLVYIIDSSGSVREDSGSDCDGDGQTDSRLRCMVEAIKNVNQSLKNDFSSVSLVGVGLFSEAGIPLSALIPDVDYGASGRTALVAPGHDGDGDGVPDFEEAVDNLPEVSGYSCLACGLDVAVPIFQGTTGEGFASEPLNTNEKNIIVFLSDGLANDGYFTKDYKALLPPGTIIKAIALGDGAVCSSPFSGHGDLNDVVAAGAEGSSCVQTNFVGLKELMVRSVGSVLSGVVLTLDDSVSLFPIVDLDLPALGPVDVSFKRKVSDLAAGPHQLCATAFGSDLAGEGSVTECQTFTLSAPPAVTLANARGAEGSAVALMASVVDPDSTPAISWSFAPVSGVDAGSTCTFSNPSSATTAMTCTDDGIYQITLTADDGDNPPVSESATLTILNVAPAVAAPAVTVNEGSAVSLTFTVTDPSSNDSFLISLDWGDGATETFSRPAGTTAFSRSRHYADDNPSGTASDVYSVAVRIEDDDGGAKTSATTITVRDVAPEVDAAAHAATIFSGQSLALSATFSDAGTFDTHTATIDWGDGSPSPTIVVGEGTLTGSHRYTELGLFTVNVCVTDDDTLTGCDSLRVEVQRLPIQIEVKPESLNIGSKGTVKVELLSSDVFAPATLIQESIRFGYTGFEATPLRLDRNLTKVDLHFERTLLGIPKSVPPNSVLPLYLTGRRGDGTLFVGSAMVRVSN